jgi:hypothetical protein
VAICRASAAAAYRTGLPAAVLSRTLLRNLLKPIANDAVAFSLTDGDRTMPIFSSHLLTVRSAEGRISFVSETDGKPVHGMGTDERRRIENAGIFRGASNEQ